MPPITTPPQKHHHNHSSSHPHLQPPKHMTKPMKQGIRALHPAPDPERDVPEPRMRKTALLRPHQHTNPLVWCGAVLCVIFSVLLIVAGIITLIVFLVIKPRQLAFDTAGASLNSVYLDSPEYFNGDFTFLANFSNPNRKIDILLEYASIELYFYNRLIATQMLPPFAQRRGEARLESVHMVSSEVYLPPDLALEIQKQVRSNRVVYNIRGTFKVRASVGLGHFTYWLYGRCVVELTSPPSGFLVARSCKTKR